MDTRQFLAEFGHIAKAPNGISRLRELVLQLAISGRLTARIETDTPVDETLATLEVDRVAYESKFKLRATRPQPPLDTSAFAIPDHWKWVRLEQLALYIQRGKGPKYAERGAVAVVSQKCVQWSGFDIALARHIDDDSVEAYGKERFLLDGDLLWNSTGTGTAGRVAIVQGVAESQAVADSHVTVVRLASAHHRYVWCVIASPWVQVRIHPAHPDSLVSGTTQQVELATSTVRALAVPCPPVEEQARIVAKVQELMALCDQLEQQQQDLRKLRKALRQSTLETLASALNPNELRTSCQRLQANFGYLFSEPADVDDVVAELKNLAVRGVLVEAGRSVADLAGITADCSALRSMYIATGLMRRQKSVDMAESDMSYPRNWAVVAFDEVAVVIGGVTKGRNLRGKQVVVCPYLAVANVQRSFFKLEDLKSIEIAEDELPKYLVHEGDLLITEGGDWDKVGRTAIWQGGIESCVHQNHVFKARVPSEKLLKAWVELVFNSGIGRNYFAGASKQTTNLASINMTQLRSFPLPIPPVDEQRRILDALATLTDLCEEWRRQLKHKRELVSLFAGASVAALTGINIEKGEDTVVKAPQTELLAPLLLAMPPDVKAQAPLATILVRHQGEMTARDLWQRFGGEIDAFYAQLKTEVARGWIAEPEVAQVREKAAVEAAKA
ncbi:Type-1 restriction enzyme EcoEI specificity protein [Stenotrophomonas maltophilia RA8]|uniref:restriction endonuclease subunit S n=1 Tax=Stenotrophomonas maltophilia TaxID=40324 RepID=UPI0002C529DA|nr:restriction endonuclease subunit S [Stenotrophomonas maltophilia]QGL75962.1 restriction endonuclease subunit S [Stenotrophomonas maltophilia]CCP16231.1 Type-1 restriction enzyme EcoEI specificity protein [Stenotrophomonas maltophilia RA8]